MKMRTGPGLIIVAYLALATPAAAVDFNETIKTFDGKEFTDQTGKPAPQVLGDVVEAALLAGGDTTAEKNKRFWLAFKIHQKRKDPELTPEEIALIKKALEVQPVAIWGQAIRMIDPTFKAPQ